MVVLNLGVGLHTLVLVVESGDDAPLRGKGLVGIETYKAVVLKLKLLERAYLGRHTHRSRSADVVTKSNLVVQVVEYIYAEALYRAQHEHKGRKDVSFHFLLQYNCFTLPLSLSPRR